MNHFQGKTILILNSGSLKKRFIFQRLKKLGLTLVCLNLEKNWAAPYVDHWILTDTYNHTDSLEELRSFISDHPKITIEGAITFWENDIPLLAKICNEYKWIGNTFETAILTRDKYKMQEAFLKAGLPAIPGKLIRKKEDLEMAMEEIGFPGILKPVSGSDSQFVVYVNNKEEAEEAYRYILKNCTSDYDSIYKLNRGVFLYQKFIDGHEFSLECFSQHGIPHVVGIHEKTAMHLPFFMETGDYIPPRIEKEEEDALIKFTESALIVLGIRNSLAHVEVKLTDKGPHIIEIASRLGGDYTFKNILEVHDFDLIEAGSEIALGINVTQKPKESKKMIMGKFLIPNQSGVINKISGFEEMKKKSYVVDFSLSKEVGDAVLVPPEGFESVGWVLVEGDSYAEVEKNMEEMLHETSIEVSPFRSYSSIGKTVRKDRFSPALLARSNFRRNKIEKIQKISRKDQRKLHIGIVSNEYSELDNPVEQELTSVAKMVMSSLSERGYRVSFFDFNHVLRASESLRESDVDIIFNLCERINDSSLLEPHAAALFDILQIPYTGSNPFTLSLCIDKIRVKKLLSYHGIPTPQWDYAYTITERIRDDLDYPLIVKPSNTDNSIGITNDSVVSNKEELKTQISYVIEKLGSPALIEEYIEGDEYDVSIMGSEEGDLEVLPLSRSVFKNLPKGYWHIYPFDAKFSSDPTYKNIIVQRPPKNIPPKLASLMSEIALDTYSILDCHDYGRVEIRVDKENNPYILELNPNPSINKGNCLPSVAELVGLDYGDFLEKIISLTINRYQHRPPYSHLQTNGV